MMRLFIAMPLPTEIEESLGKVIFVLKQNRTRVKWVAPKNIHLTIKFLGEAEDSTVSEISGAIDRVAQKHGIVRSAIDKLGAFPSLKRPRVFWAGLSEATEALAAIASDVEDEMAGFGFTREDRPFRCHLTLGRVKDSSGLVKLVDAVKGYEFAPETVTFDRIVLFKSTLTPRGPIYERLFEAKLKA